MPIRHSERRQYTLFQIACFQADDLRSRKQGNSRKKKSVRSCGYASPRRESITTPRELVIRVLRYQQRVKNSSFSSFLLRRVEALAKVENFQEIRNVLLLPTE